MPRARPRHDANSHSPADAAAAQGAWERWLCLQAQADSTAALQRRSKRGVDYYPFIEELQRTARLLRQGSLHLQQLLLFRMVNQGTLQDVLSVCNKVDAAEDAALCFVYPTEDTPTVTAAVGDLLHEVVRCLTALDDDCAGCLRGRAAFSACLQRQLAPALAQLLGQATAVLNAAHDQLLTLATPLPSLSPHALLHGAVLITRTCFGWGGPRGDPRPYSTIVSALAREHTLDAAARLLAALQDPALVARPATPATHPDAFASLHTLTEGLLAHLSPDSDPVKIPLDSDATLTPAARDALRTHMLADHHLLVLAIRSAAACCHAPASPAPPRASPPSPPPPRAAPAATTPVPTPALTPALRLSMARSTRRILDLASPWLNDPQRQQKRWYTAAPEAVWQAVAQLLAAVAQPQGWQVAGNEALALVGCLPIGDLAVCHPDLAPDVARPVVEVLLRQLQELRQRRQQLERPKPWLWELLVQLNWEERRDLAVACHEAVIQCLVVLWALVQAEADWVDGFNGNLAFPTRRADLDKETAPVTWLLNEAQVLRRLQEALNSIRPTPSPPEEALAVLDRIRYLLVSMNTFGLAQLPPRPYQDAWVEYLRAVFGMVAMLLTFGWLLLEGACNASAVMWRRALHMAVTAFLSLLASRLAELMREGAFTLQPALLVLDACPDSASQLLMLAGGWLRGRVGGRRADLDASDADGATGGGMLVVLEACHGSTGSASPA